MLCPPSPTAPHIPGCGTWGCLLSVPQHRAATVPRSRRAIAPELAQRDLESHGSGGTALVWLPSSPAPALPTPGPALTSPLTCRGGRGGPSCLWLPSGGPDWPARLILSFIGTLSSGAAATRPPPPARCLWCLAPLPACLPARLSPSPPALLWHKCPTTPPTPVPSLPASCHRDPRASVSPQQAVPSRGRCPPLHQAQAGQAVQRAEPHPA